MSTLTRVGILRRPPFTAAQLAYILDMPRPGECGWLDGSCRKPVAAGHWVCAGHAARFGGGS